MVEQSDSGPVRDPSQKWESWFRHSYLCLLWKPGRRSCRAECLGWHLSSLPKPRLHSSLRRGLERFDAETATREYWVEPPEDRFAPEPIV